MTRFARRRLLIAVSLAALLLAPLAVFLLGRGQDLKSRLALVSIGMTREKVEGILGRPAVALHRTPLGTGEVLYWVDQLSQVIEANGVECVFVASSAVATDMMTTLAVEIGVPSASTSGDPSCTRR